MGFRLNDLARHLGADLHGDSQCVVTHIATLNNAAPGALSFLSNRRYKKFLKTTRASAVILAASDLGDCPVAALVVDNPQLAYAKAAALLNPEEGRPAGIHASASVSSESHVDPSAWIGQYVVVEPGVRVGARAFIGPGCMIGENVAIGEDTQLLANVTLCRGVQVGNNTRIHPGAVIGADGFGLAQDEGVWVKVPQLGAVRIGSNVEIGANTTVDRGTVDDTVIEDGVKIDNQVQVGHNVWIGAHTAIAGCTGIAGSTRIGRHCIIGGAAGIAGHIDIADHVVIEATSGVLSSITQPGVYSSILPAQEEKEWMRNLVRVRDLDNVVRRMQALEKACGIIRERGTARAVRPQGKKIDD